MKFPGELYYGICRKDGRVEISIITNLSDEHTSYFNEEFGKMRWKRVIVTLEELKT